MARAAHHRAPLLCGVIVWTASAAASGLQGDLGPRQSELGPRIDDYLERLVPWGFSGSVLISRHGRIALANGYGLADRERGIHNGAETVFPLGALSRQFTAAAVLLLEEQGKLSLVDLLERHFESVPADKRELTLQQLLAHTSGLPADAGDGALHPAREQALAAILAAPLVSAPGERTSESSLGFSLLAAVIERVSGATFEEFLRTSLFAPAHMANTGFAGEERWREAPLARGQVDDVAQSPATALRPTLAALGAGAILSTAGDLYRWERAISTGAVLGPAASAKLFTPLGGEWTPGWRATRGADGKACFVAGGELAGISCEYRRYPDEGVALILLSNAQLAGAILRVEDLVFGRECRWPPAVGPYDDRAGQSAAGSYELPAGGRVRILFERSRLAICGENQGGIDALAQPPPDARAWQEQFSARTQKLFEHLRQRDFPAAAALLGSDPREVDNELGTWWRRFEEQHGAARSVQVLGALWRERAVFVRIEFERARELRRVRWDGDKLGSIAPSGERFASGLLWPRSDADWVSFDPESGSTVSLGLLLRADQSVRGLAVRGEGGDLVARKLD